MKFDKEKLNMLMSLPDEELWRTVRMIGRERGLELPEKPPAHSEMEKMRNAVGSGGRINLGEAMRIINNYKRGEGNGRNT